MIIKDNITIELTLVDNINLEERLSLKTLEERCRDVCEMICDEAAQTETMVTYNVAYAERKVDI